jgi:hypothetical protein
MLALQEGHDVTEPIARTLQELGPQQLVLPLVVQVEELLDELRVFCDDRGPLDITGTDLHDQSRETGIALPKGLVYHQHVSDVGAVS